MMSTAFNNSQKTTTKKPEKKKTQVNAVQKNQLSIPVMIEKSNIVGAEIRWCLQVVQSKYSQRSCNGIVELFTVMFPDSDIAKMTLKKDKCGYMINYGIAPHLQELLLSEIKSSPFYSLSFDESLNSKLQKGQMDISCSFLE